MAEGLGHHALAVGVAIGWAGHDIGVGIDDRFADVAGGVLGAPVVVGPADDARSFGGDVAEVGTDRAARPRTADVVAGSARQRLVELGAAGRIAARRHGPTPPRLADLGAREHERDREHREACETDPSARFHALQFPIDLSRLELFR